MCYEVEHQRLSDIIFERFLSSLKLSNMLKKRKLLYFEQRKYELLST